MRERKVISITTNLSRYGGAQKVLMDVHNGLKGQFNCLVTGRQAFEQLHPKYQIAAEEYILFHPRVLKNNIVLVHARNLIPFIVFLNKLLRLNARVIYISHNVYRTYRRLTFFPENIVSISQKVTQNLENYFKVKGKKITLIYNGIRDTAGIPEAAGRQYKQQDAIKILYPARVNQVKRQLQIVNRLKDKIAANIEIHFAGAGEDLEALKQCCDGLPNFKVLGFVNDMERLIPGYDYLMLYSVQEGLPIALLEGIMHGKPLLVNDVGGNLEIGVPQFNAIRLEDGWEGLGTQINGLNDVTGLQYAEMAANSRSHFLARFQYGQMIKEYEQLINTLST
ncbi:glycosyltransferase family 4 protein [Niabella sp.]|uniref:glycosyltransferase family 4 protein n=1 Tax=Niabella sp. TaxID=1962976 RepID=UPI002603967B|nr:glycosyltransferase family 4 protein [Niabella sp.]